MTEIESLQTLCAKEVVRLLKSRQGFGNVSGCLKVYSTLSPFFELHPDPISSNGINPIGSSDTNPILYIKYNCISKLSDYYPMLREKYGDEELSTIIREDDLSVMRTKFDSYLTAKNRFAALKGTVLEAIPPVESMASRAVQPSSIVECVPVNSKKSTTSVIYSGQTAKETQAASSRLAPSTSASVATTNTTTSSTTTTSCSGGGINVITIGRDDELSSSSTDSLYYPYDALIQGHEWPAGVDPAKREQYLSPDDFFKIFKMSKSAFSALDKHKKIRIKKEVRLF